MKHKYILLVLLYTLTLAAVFSVNAIATGTGFSTYLMPKDEAESFIQNINLTVISEEPAKAAIECFDVADNGVIAVGHGSSNRKNVSIYDGSGKFQYGYTFECYGSFGLEWSGTDLVLYFVRGDVALGVSQDGTISEACYIQNTAENNSHWNSFVFATERNHGDTNYRIENDLGIFNLTASNFTRLVVTNADGDENIIYDVNSEQLFKMIILSVFIVVFVGLAVFAIIRKMKELR